MGRGTHSLSHSLTLSLTLSLTHSLIQDFNDQLIDALNTFSSKYDKVDQSRFGWFREYDIEILNAMAVPYGDTRDPIEIESDKSWIGFKKHFNDIISGQYNEFELVVLGIVLGLLFILIGTHSLTHSLTRSLS